MTKGGAQGISFVIIPRRCKNFHLWGWRKEAFRLAATLETSTIQEFCEALSSKSPVPGGGGAAAVGGALGCSLGAMVCNLTIGKKRYREFEPRLQELLQQLTGLRDAFEALVEADADAFAPLSQAYKLPSATDEERENKAIVMEVALGRAVGPPMEMLANAAQAAKLLEEAGGMCSRLVLSDIGVGASFLEATAYSGYLNVAANTGLMRDREYAARLDAEAKRLCDECCALCARIRQRIG